MEAGIAAIGAIAVATITAILGWWGSRKYHIGANQDKLISTLNDLVAVQEMRIRILEQTSVDNKLRIGELEGQVRDLQLVIVKQASQLTALNK